MKLRPIWLAVFVATAPLYAQEVGETVVIVAPKKAELKRDDRIVDLLPRGAPVTIEAVGPKSLRVAWLGMHGWVNKGETLRLDDAIRYFRRVIEKSPDASDYWGCGNAWFCKGENDKAIALFTKAIGLNSEYCPVYRVSRESPTLKRVTSTRRFQTMPRLSISARNTPPRTTHAALPTTRIASLTKRFLTIGKPSALIRHMPRRIMTWPVRMHT